MTQQFRVLHIIPSIAPEHGGPSTVIQPLVNALQLDGLSVDIACTTNKATAKNNDIMQFHRVLGERWKFSPDLAIWLYKKITQYDLVHIHSLWSFSSSWAALVCRLRDVPYVVRPAGMLSDYTFSQNTRLKKIYWAMIEKATLCNASAIHVTSDGEASDVSKLIERDTIHIIPNGLPTSAFSIPTRKADLITRHQSNSKQVILFLSRLHPKKGLVDRLLPALKILKDTHLVIVGDEDRTSTGYTNKISESVKRMGLEGRVTLTGPVYGDERWALYDSADLFVLPSHSENFGLVVAEAMVRGCPQVITKEVQSYPLLIESRAGIVTQGDRLAEACKRILRSPDTQKNVCRWNTICERSPFMVNNL